jgi:hypothetical protein
VAAAAAVATSAEQRRSRDPGSRQARRSHGGPSRRGPSFATRLQVGDPSEFFNILDSFSQVCLAIEARQSSGYSAPRWRGTVAECILAEICERTPEHLAVDSIHTVVPSNGATSTRAAKQVLPSRQRCPDLGIGRSRLRRKLAASCPVRDH